jgi:hypothetical protein
MSEQTDQEALFAWAALQTTRLPELALLFHVPNGEKRDKATAARLQRAGVKAGCPDLWLPVARLGFHGLVLELKVSGGRLSVAQRAWLAALTTQGYKAEVCYGWQDAATEIETYLTWEPT